MPQYREDRGDGQMDVFGRRWLGRAADTGGRIGRQSDEFKLGKLADRGELPNRTD
jgi:hypothetical protein